MIYSINIYQFTQTVRRILLLSFVGLAAAILAGIGIQSLAYAAELSPDKPDTIVTLLSVGSNHNCEIRSDSTLACWGQNDDEEATPPTGLFTQVAAGTYHTCAIKSDGTLTCWGDNSSEQATPPSGTFTQVTAGESHSCAIKSNKTVVCWGDADDGKITPPSGSFTQISAGAFHTCGIQANGSVACWGNDEDGQSSAPGGAFKQISAGAAHTCGIKSNNTVACWGNDEDGQSSAPGGAFKQISAGAAHTCGIKDDGTVVCWGDSSEEQATPPAGNFSQVDAGELHTCGLRSDGVIVCWGSNEIGQAPTFQLNPVTLPGGQINTPYNQAISVDAENYTPTIPILTVSSGLLPTGLSLNGTSGVINGTPTVGGAFSFFIRAVDANGINGEQKFTLKINRSPVANSQNVTLGQNTPTSILLTASDPEGDALTYSVTTNPAHGALSGAAPNLVYTPNTGYSGPDSFAFKANDGKADSNTATININVTSTQAPNTPPIANAQNVATLRNAPRAITLTGSDVDHNPLTYSVVSTPGHGVLSGTAPNLTYTPATGYTGTDSFTFKVNDGLADSNVATINITVSANNTPPEAHGRSVLVQRNTAKAITLTAFDSEGDALTYVVVSNPFSGTLTGTPPNLLYTPTTGFFGIDSFTFKVNDGLADSNTATVGITVTPNVPIQIAPVADNKTVVTLRNTPQTLTLTASDANDDPVSYILMSNPTHGILSGVAPDLTYTPDPGFSGADSFTFKVNDGQDDSNVATVTITVIATDTPPVANDQNVSLSQDRARTIILVASDADNESLVYSIVANPAHGTLSGTPPNLVYTPTAGYTGADSFTFKASDGQTDSNIATVTINVTTGQATNTPPIANDQNFTTPQDAAKDLILTASDADGDPLSYAIVANPTHGALSGTAPTLTYTPNAGYTGDDSFTFKVNDGQADSNVAMIQINVTATAAQGSITGLIYDDKNSNGQQDSDEAGVANVTVILNNATRSANAERRATTNADGVYHFGQVAPGSYTLQIEASDSFVLAGPAQLAITVGQSGEVTPPAFVVVVKVSNSAFLPLIQK